MVSLNILKQKNGIYLPETRTTICSNCTARIQKNYSFCPECGQLRGPRKKLPDIDRSLIDYMP